LTQLCAGIDNTDSLTYLINIVESVMETEIAATTASKCPEAIACSKGSLAAIGSATKAFVVFHPVGIALAGGLLAGLGIYYAYDKLCNNKGKCSTEHQKCGSEHGHEATA
jgi:hypothetical protein